MKKIFFGILLLLFQNFSFSQSIVNTEKLFTTNDEGIGISSELAGSAISGNTSILVLEYGLNFSFKRNKNYFRLLSGGEYMNENNEEVANGLFSQLRYNYFFNKKLRFFAFTQVQKNSILLLERRFLVGSGIRRNLIDIKKDSTNRYEFDVSLGLMQEEELLNKTNLPSNEMNYTNYTRAIFSLVGVIDIKGKYTIVNTTYFQQYLGKFSDFRLLNETNLLVQLNDWLNFNIDIEYRYDNEPPSILLDKDLNINLGFILNL